MSITVHSAPLSNSCETVAAASAAGEAVETPSAVVSTETPVVRAASIHSPTEPETRLKSIQYIGNKTRLITPMLDFFSEIRCNRLSAETTIVDVFCGSASVTYAAASAGYHVKSFDTESYALALAAGATTPFTTHAEAAIRSIQDYSNETAAPPRQPGLIEREYSPTGPWKRMFWTSSNAERIDAARLSIATHPNSALRPFLLASLLVSADSVANTTAVYGAYLKSFKRSAQKPIEIKPLHTNPVCAPAGAALLPGIDANSALIALPRRRRGDTRRGLTIVYADPPYNARQYSANYAPLKVITDYTEGVVRENTKTGLVVDPYRSPFCSTRSVRQAFQQLVTAVAPRADYLVLSYSSEGLLDPADLGEIINAVVCKEVPQQARSRSAKSDCSIAHRTVTEYTYVVSLHERARAALTLRH